MAKRDKSVDLYEALASKKNDSSPVGSSPGVAAAPESGPAPAPAESVANQAPAPAVAEPVAPARKASPREIVFGIDAGFVLFVAVLMIVGCAYYLGFQRGKIEASRKGFSASGSIENRPGADAAAGLEGASIGVRIDIPANKYVLRVRSAPRRTATELKRLKQDKLFIERLPGVRKGNFPVYIFDNGKVYSLGAGVFDSRTDPEIKSLFDMLAGEKGPSTSSGALPYNGARVVIAGDMGKVVSK